MGRQDPWILCLYSPIVRSHLDTTLPPSSLLVWPAVPLCGIDTTWKSLMLSMCAASDLPQAPLFLDVRCTMYVCYMHACARHRPTQSNHSYLQYIIGLPM